MLGTPGFIENPAIAWDTLKGSSELWGTDNPVEPMLQGLVN